MSSSRPIFELTLLPFLRSQELPAPDLAMSRSASSLSYQHDNHARRQFELAGGIEDWEDVNGADVDRYGFINTRRLESRQGTPTESKSAQFSPRRRIGLSKRDLSSLSPSFGVSQTPSRKVSARSLNTQASELSTASRRSTRSALRQAGNLLPYNRDRRCMDEAGDMLTLTPGLSDIAEDPKVEKISEALKRKEWERSEKWRRMAKIIKKGKDGEGMEFDFDVKNPKLIDRTWKGIPDRWRAAAWYSFLAASAVNRPGSATEDQIVADFKRLQDVNSPDDMQIDLDVPRTINRHIMFRRRYRGGQRLLFRVLHALSLYFPDTGYVQGMASLAATLLCYFDEEKAFVMLVRMWQLRGLERLYKPGFEGLMTALKDFETQWLEGKDVAKKLVRFTRRDFSCL
jgi:Rab-GTPase-TBC domain